jgi:hydroxypyruvate reductase
LSASGKTVVNDSSQRLVRDAIDIWRAGTQAVDSALLVKKAVRVEDGQLHFGPHCVDLGSIGRIVVVGAGKAGAGMVLGLVEALGPKICESKQLTGWVNVPDDCVRVIPGIHVFAARPVGVNLPTPRVVDGTRQILKLVQDCAPNDVCVCLISGGGSALLSLPVEQVSLDDQIELIEFLSASRANIQDLNTVRKRISQVKGGRLASSCRGKMFTLIISDVLGDPLDVIASGPTVADSSTTDDALNVLRRFDPSGTMVPRSIYGWLRGGQSKSANKKLTHVQNIVIGNLRVAVEAAARRAKELNYLTESHIPTTLEGSTDEVARSMAARIQTFDALSGPRVFVDGGEPVVQLVDRAERGLGGRNQHVILSIADRMRRNRAALSKSFCALAGGTDGEDGPTDAAGAWIDTTSLDAMQRLGLDPSDFLARNDAYHFFEQLGTLFKVGPTHTNVCDLRLVLSR